MNSYKRAHVGEGGGYGESLPGELGWATLNWRLGIPSHFGSPVGQGDCAAPSRCAGGSGHWSRAGSICEMKSAVQRDPDRDEPGIWLARFSKACLRITSMLDLDSVLQEIIDSACLLTDARYGALLTFDESGDVRKLKTFGITPEERRQVGDWPKGQGLLGHLNEIAGSLSRYQQLRGGDGRDCIFRPYLHADIFGAMPTTFISQPSDIGTLKGRNLLSSFRHAPEYLFYSSRRSLT